MNDKSYHVFNITFLGPENKRTGGFSGVSTNPRFFKDQPTLICGAESKDMAAAAHAENKARKAENDRREEFNKELPKVNAERAKAVPALPLLSPEPILPYPIFKIELVREPTNESPDFDDLMTSLREHRNPAKPPKK